LEGRTRARSASLATRERRRSTPWQTVELGKDHPRADGLGVRERGCELGSVRLPAALCFDVLGHQGPPDAVEATREGFAPSFDAKAAAALLVRRNAEITNELAVTTA